MLLEATRKHCPEAVFIYTSTNKVYGDNPNKLPLVELESRWEVAPGHPFAEHGIDESMSVDQTKHSLFGVSKLAADAMVQEYGRYFGMKTGVFRGGCLTGPGHSGTMLHGFLSYLVKCAITGQTYTVFGYKGKQVRDNIHSFDLINMFWHFYQAPRPGEVYNAGGGRHSNCSMQEAIALCEEMAGKKMNAVYSRAEPHRRPHLVHQRHAQVPVALSRLVVQLRSASASCRRSSARRPSDLTSGIARCAMTFESILITGGAGFVGSSLALRFKGLFPQVAVTAFDNLHRRGSELNLPRLQAAGVQFRHGDIRCPEDLEQLPDFDLLIDCAAEPSVQAGVGESPQYVLNNNLVGTINCLEAARLRKARFVLLSTSRVYPIDALNRLPFAEEDTRFRWTATEAVPGFSAQGIAEEFPLDGAAVVLRRQQAGRRIAAAGIRLRHGKCRR